MPERPVASVVVRPVSPQELIARIREALNESGTATTWEDIVSGLKAGKYQIFWNNYGCAVTEVLQLGQRRVLHVWFVVGHVPETISDLQAQTLRHARLIGCSQITFTPTGDEWSAVMLALGWKLHSANYSFDVRA